MGRGRQIKIDVNKMRKDVAKSKTGTEFIKLQEGLTLLYLCPPVHEDSPVHYAEGQLHYQLGPSTKKVAVCLAGQEDCKPILDTLDGMGLAYEDAEAGWERIAELVAKEGSDRQKAKNQWWFNAVIMGTRARSSRPWDEPEPQVGILRVGKMIFDGITDIIFDEEDLSNPDEAILIIIKKSGAGMSTEYKVFVDTKSVKDPIVIDDDLWEQIEKNCVPGKANDLHRHIALMCRSEAQAEAMWYGEEEDGEEKEEEKPRGRRKPKVSRRSVVSSRRKARAPEPEEEEPEGDVEEEIEEEEEAPKPRRKTRRKKAPEPEPDVDDDEEEGDDDDGDDEPEPKPKPRRKTRKAPVSDDEGDDEGEDDAAAQLEAELRARQARRKRK